MRRLRRIAFFEALLVLLLILGVVFVPQPPVLIPAARIFDPSLAGTVQRDVTYCAGGDLALKMDIFYPKMVDAAPAPVALYVHGGGWTTGSKDWLGRVVDPNLLTAKGFFVAAVDYRLAPQYRWPAQIEDVKCAVRYLRANARTYHIDSGRIGVFGESAGGHLASLMGLAGAQAGFEGSGGYPDQSSRVQAVVDMCGPTDFTTFDVNSYTKDVAEALFGVKGVKGSLQAASPVSYIDPDAPPFLIVQGDRDLVVPPAQSEELYNKLTEAGDNATLITVRNAGHVFAPAFGTPTPSMPEIQAMVVDFFQKTLLEQPLASRYFPETGKVVRGSMLRYWSEHGGIARLGYPISEEIVEKSDMDENTYTVQYFERGVMERHPENKPPYGILLSLLGSYRYVQKYPGGAPGQVPNNSPGSVLFAQTGHRVGGAFLAYWQSHGGLAQQGYPVSDEFTEMSDLDGKPYMVQYFERAVFEFHPENPPESRVLLSQLGTYRYNEKHAPTDGKN